MSQTKSGKFTARAESVIRPIEELRNWAENPREIDEDDFDRLKQQIEQLGAYKPILTTVDGEVLGGNMRLRALTALGETHVWCSVVNPANDKEKVAYALSDNDQAGRYAEQQLAELVSKYEVDLKLFKVDLGTPSSLEDVVSKYSPEDEPDEGEEGEGEEADPPYMVDYHSASGVGYESSKFGGDGVAIFNDDLNDEDAAKFFTDIATNLYMVTKDSAPFYWWLAMKNWHINHAALVASGWYVSQTLIWVKEHMVFAMGADFHRLYEPCMIGWKKGKKHFSNKRLANYKDVMALGRDDFLELPDIWFEKRDDTAEYIHPTQKPIGLVKRALKKHTRPDALVIDLFGGSGSTIIGCEDMKRRCYAMELDPKFVDAIRKRYAKFIGQAEDWQTVTPEV